MTPATMLNKGASSERWVSEVKGKVFVLRCLAGTREHHDGEQLVLQGDGWHVNAPFGVC